MNVLRSCVMYHLYFFNCQIITLHWNQTNSTVLWHVTHTTSAMYVLVQSKTTFDCSTIGNRPTSNLHLSFLFLLSGGFKKHLFLLLYYSKEPRCPFLPGNEKQWGATDKSESSLTIRQLSCASLLLLSLLCRLLTLLLTVCSCRDPIIFEGPLQFRQLQNDQRIALCMLT